MAHAPQQTFLVGGEHRDVVPDGPQAFGDGLVDVAGLPSRIRREHRLGGADGFDQLADGGRDVEQQVALLAPIVVVGDATRQAGELAGSVFDHTEFGHQCSLAGDLIGDFVDIAVAVVEGLTVVHGLPLDADLTVLVDTAGRRERLSAVLLGEVHDRQWRMIAPQPDRQGAGVRRPEQQVFVAFNGAQRLR